MAEILLRVKDKPSSGDISVDLTRLGRGHVVTIMPDNHQWSEAEINNPDWRIIRVPGLNTEQLSVLLEPDLGIQDPLILDKTKLRRRQWRLNIKVLDLLLNNTSMFNDMCNNANNALQYIKSCIIPSKNI